MKSFRNLILSCGIVGLLTANAAFAGGVLDAVKHPLHTIKHPIKTTGHVVGAAVDDAGSMVRHPIRTTKASVHAGTDTAGYWAHKTKHAFTGDDHHHHHDYDH
jgi:hypothetical protein